MMSVGGSESAVEARGLTFSLPQVSSAAKAGGIREVSAEDEKTNFFTGSQVTFGFWLTK
jgi:hypothetical protein